MMPLPTCPVHKGSHQPVLCRTEGVWHPYVCVPKTKERDAEIRGTHGGSLGEAPRHRLDDERRETRRIKNLRNYARRGGATHIPGAQKRVTSRMFRFGSRSTGRVPA